MRSRFLLASILALALGAAPLSGAARSRPDEKPLAEASLIVESNATDGDAGIQPFLDGEPWRRAVVYRPDGGELFEVQARGDLRRYGLTELFSESSEPPFNEFSLDRFRELFPEGEYRFEATAVDGSLMVGSATLSHFPAGPTIVSPAADATVPSTAVVVSWEPVTEPVGIEIDGYQVLVVQEDPVLRTFSADLPASATTLSVPPEFVQPGVEYKVEVLAVAASGNKMLTELTFTAS